MISEFTDLTVWQKGHQLVLAVYRLNHSFPPVEKFGLGDQIRRAVVSITSNIAEGFGRHTIKEKLQFYYQSHGSLTEVKNQLIIAKDLKYISLSQYTQVFDLVIEVQKLLLGLITKTKTYL